jgi:hypothetical protein
MQDISKEQRGQGVSFLGLCCILKWGHIIYNDFSKYWIFGHTEIFNGPIEMMDVLLSLLLHQTKKETKSHRLTNESKNHCTSTFQHSRSSWLYY